MKMKTAKLLFTLSLPLTLVAFSLAETDDAPVKGPRPGHRPPPPLVHALDINHDGVISASEIAAAPTALRSLDTNGDGVISADELHPPLPADSSAHRDHPAPPATVSRAHPTPPLMLALDANADGSLSATEIANAPTSLAALDFDHDGQLSGDEIHPPGPSRD